MAISTSLLEDVPEGNADALPAFGAKEYWDHEYLEASEEFDWLFGWDEIAVLVEPLLAQDFSKSILHLGTGSSLVAEDMFKAGYTNQVATDISEVCVERMRRRAGTNGFAGLEYLCADATDLSAFKDNSFDMVFDKGCFDALCCADEDHAWKLLQMLKEAHRVMKKAGGIYVVFSMYTSHTLDPYFRLPCFGWQSRVVPLLDQDFAALQRRRQALWDMQEGVRLEEGTAVAAEQQCHAAPHCPQNFRYCHIFTDKSDTSMATHWAEISRILAASPGEDPSRELITLDRAGMASSCV